MKLLKRTDEQKAEVSQLTDKDGLGGSYSADNGFPIIDNTVYKANTQMNRASDWYDDFLKGANTLECRPKNKSIFTFHVWNEGSTIYRGLSKEGR